MVMKKKILSEENWVTILSPFVYVAYFGLLALFVLLVIKGGLLFANLIGFKV